MQVIVFSRPGCEGCDRLKAFLQRQKVEHRDINGDSAEGRTYMRINGVFLAYYPAICVSGRLYEYPAIFDEHGELLADDLRKILGVS